MPKFYFGFGILKKLITIVYSKGKSKSLYQKTSSCRLKMKTETEGLLKNKMHLFTIDCQNVSTHFCLK
jgi:hypothetical protein